MSEKMMSFEEWWGGPDAHETNWICRTTKERCQIAWDASRIGMIDAGAAIQVPPVEEWPEWAEAVDVSYLGPYSNNGREVKSIKRIPRPIPTWTPKIGEAVFYKHSGNSVGVGEISEIRREGGTAYYMKGVPAWGWHLVKKFDEKYIGFAWDQIPWVPE